MFLKAGIKQVNLPQKASFLKVLAGFALFYMASFGALRGQEAEIVPLTFNPQLMHHQSRQLNPRLLMRAADTLQLPFLDDFSSQAMYPEDSLWQDKNVYINNRMPINPPSFGVATFDGLGPFGRPYKPSKDNNNTTLPTDTLTSQMIDMADLSGQDSVFLSFFFQPKGRGDNPEAIDSFKLQFKGRSDTNQWKTVWSAGGRTFYSKTPAFRAVNLNVAKQDSGKYFHGAFQFRFISFGNLSGNLDHWHLDYVYLDKNRQPGPPIRQDVAMIDPAMSILKKYRALPWRQVVGNANMLRETFYIKGGNNDDEVSVVKCGYAIEEEVTGKRFENFTKDFTENILGFFDKRVYQQDNLFNLLPFVGKDSLVLEIRSAVFESSDNFRQNDTFVQHQKMGNYVAYDDGTAEAGFSISGRFYDDWQVAYQFNLNKSDTLRAVGMKFNRSRKPVDNRLFNLVVWRKIGDGAEIAYEMENLSIRYNGQGHDNFVIYELETPISVTGTFYVGWKQLSPYPINLGVDKNYQDLYNETAPENKIFVNFDGNWQETAAIDSPGRYALMIRPYLSQEPITDYTHKSQPAKQPFSNLKTYPNPARDFVNLELSAFAGRLNGELLNTKGHIVRRFAMQGSNKRLNLAALRPGLYILRLHSRNGEHHFTKKILLE